MDTRGYENPFASSKEEIGQSDVPVDDEAILRESIRSMILEVNGYQCTHHSLGWIDDDGDWMSCEGMSHGEWLYRYHYDEEEPEDGIEIPQNWIKVSNAENIFFCGRSWDDVTNAQIEGLIEMWSECSRYSKWIQYQTETFEVTFGMIDSFEMRDNGYRLTKMTIPEFLGMYGGRDSIDNFYGMLLGEL